MKRRPPDAAGAGGHDALVDAQLLRLLDLLYRTRSVTKAAEVLGLSQPTLSIRLGRLRRQLDDPLFVRTPEGMLPTPRMQAQIGTVRETLALMRSLVASPGAFDAAASQRSFRICMTDASHITLLPQLLAHLRGLAPSVRLVAARIDPQTGSALQSGEADLAIGHVPWLDAGYYQQVLYPQDWVCLAQARHPRVAGGLSIRAYRSEGHVGIVGGTGADLLDNALARQRVERRVVLELPGFLGLGRILATTDLIATLPRHIGETLAAASGLAVLECPVAIPSFSVKQYWHARVHRDVANGWLRSQCAALLQDRRIKRGEAAAGALADRTSRTRNGAGAPSRGRTGGAAA